MPELNDLMETLLNQRREERDSKRFRQALRVQVLEALSREPGGLDVSQQAELDTLRAQQQAEADLLRAYLAGFERAGQDGIAPPAEPDGTRRSALFGIDGGRVGADAVTTVAEPELAPGKPAKYPVLGATLERLRLDCGWSQEELAERAGKGVETIKLACQGRSRPHPGTLRKIADAINKELKLQLTASDLLGADAHRPARRPSRRKKTLPITH